MPRKENLYYFGKYYSKNELSGIKPISNRGSSKLLNQKKEILFKIYKSQKCLKTSFKHILEYENWIKATEWRKNHKI